MKKEYSKFASEILLKRFDGYITQINSKSAFLIGFNTFILGAIVIKIDDITTLFSHLKISLFVPLIVFIVLIGSVLSLFYALKASYPYLDSGNKNADYHSSIFFGSVAEMEQQTFMSKFKEQTEDELHNDLLKQCHILAICAKDKHLLVQQSVNSVQFGVLLPISILAILKLIEYFITT